MASPAPTAPGIGAVRKRTDGGGWENGRGLTVGAWREKDVFRTELYLIDTYHRQNITSGRFPAPCAPAVALRRSCVSVASLLIRQWRFPTRHLCEVLSSKTVQRPESSRPETACRPILASYGSTAGCQLLSGWQPVAPGDAAHLATIPNHPHSAAGSPRGCTPAGQISFGVVHCSFGAIPVR